MRELLGGFGLTPEEQDLYLVLLELGGGVASHLAKRAKRKRSSAYHTLGKLVERGLASRVTKGGTLYYLPEPPERLVELARIQLSAAERALPELRSIQNTLPSKPKVKFYERASGIEQIFQDTLLAQEEILGYTNLSLLIELFPGFFRRYTGERLSRGIKVRYLSPRPAKGVEVIEEFFASEESRALLEVLFVNPKEFPFQSEFVVYGEKVAMMTLSREEQMALLIESRAVARTMKAVFDLAWIGASAFIAR